MELQTELKIREKINTEIPPEIIKEHNKILFQAKEKTIVIEVLNQKIKYLEDRNNEHELVIKDLKEKNLQNENILLEEFETLLTSNENLQNENEKNEIKISQFTQKELELGGVVKQLNIQIQENLDY
jgi:hypothetical protein